MSPASRPLVYLIAGEPSGDLIAARLMEALRQMTAGEIEFAGIGGEAMRAQGLTTLFPQSELAVIGLVEIVRRLRRLTRRLHETVADIRRRAPRAVVTVDSWEFARRVASRLKSERLPATRIHYVAPMVWAWRRGRVHEVAACIDLLLCLWPFEPRYFQEVGVEAVHVGHAVVEGGASAGDGRAFRLRHGIAPDAPLVCMLPGSRGVEVQRLLPVFAETLGLLARSRPALSVVCPTVETVSREVRQAVQAWSLPVVVVDGAAERYDAFAASDVALAASGTVALELGLAGTPMVIGYRLSPVTGWLFRLVTPLRDTCLLNVLAGRRIVPEFVQRDCRASVLSSEVSRLLDDESARRQQHADVSSVLCQLGQGGDEPSRRAAVEVLHRIAAAP